MTRLATVALATAILVDDQLLATTGAFPVNVSGRVEMPFSTHPALSAGDYWFEAVYDQPASLGILQGTSDLVTYRVLTFTGSLPTTFGTPQMYTGQTFNYYFSATPVPEPSAMVLLGIAACGAMVRRGRRRKQS